MTAPDAPLRSFRGSVLGDLLAPLFLLGYLVVLFEPFYEIRAMPGSVPTFVLPALGIGALVSVRAVDAARAPVNLTVLVLAAWMALSITWSDARATSVFEVRTTLPGLVLAGLVVGAMPARTVVATCAAFFAGVAAWTTPAELAFGPAGVDSWQGTFIHKNSMGVTMVLGLGLVLAFPDRWARWRRPMLAALLVAAVGSRSATVGAGLAALGATWVWMRVLRSGRDHRDRAVVKLLAVVVLALAAVAVVGLFPFLAGLYGKDVTLTGRTTIWAAAWDSIAARPWQGYGAGGLWTEALGPATRDLWTRIGFEAAHAHSGVLDLVLELGIVGLVLYAAFTFDVVRLGLRAMGERTGAGLGWWMALTLVPLHVMALAEPLYRRPTLGYLVVVWAVLRRHANDQSRGEAGTSDSHRSPAARQPAGT